MVIFLQALSTRPEEKVKIECTVDPQLKRKLFLMEGELDVHNVKLLKNHVVDSLDNEKWEFVVDMARIGYLDSSGLGMLVFLKKEIIKNGSTFRIVNLQDPVMSVFRLTKLDGFFNLEQKPVS